MPRGAPFAYGVAGDRTLERPSSETPQSRRMRAIPGGAAATTTGETPRVLRAARQVGEQLFPLDDETREARNARLLRVGTGVGSVALAGVLVYSVFPVRTYLDQREASERTREQLDVLTRENERLERRVRDLRRDETIEEIARRDHGFVMPGEESYAVLPAPLEDAGDDDAD